MTTSRKSGSRKDLTSDERTAVKASRGTEPANRHAATLGFNRTVGNRAAGRAFEAVHRGETAPAAIQRFLTYRAGGNTENNMTPKEKDTKGNKRGLSTFTDPTTAPIKIASAQEIETDKLAGPLVAIANGAHAGDTHVSIRPPGQANLDNWAGRKDPEFPAYSQNVLNARTGTVWKPKK